MNDPIETLPPPSGWALIAAERHRQQHAEGYTSEHDDRHRGSELADAALVYAFCATLPEEKRVALGRVAEKNFGLSVPPDDWPWQRAAFKPTWDDPVRMFVKAGALLAAEIDRLQRLGSPPRRFDSSDAERHGY